MTNCASGSARGNLRDAVANDRQQPFHLVRAAAWQQRHDRPRWIELKLLNEAVARFLRSRQIHEWMADELHRHVGIAVQLLFERKNDQHAVGKPLHHAHAALSPCPQLRAYVIDDRDAELLDRGGKPEIEVGKVDDDEGLRLLGAGDVNQLPEHRQRPGNHPQRLDEPGDAETAVIGNQLCPAGHQTLAAESKNRGVGLTPPNFDCEGAGV